MQLISRMVVCFVFLSIFQDVIAVNTNEVVNQLDEILILVLFLIVILRAIKVKKIKKSTIFIIVPLIGILFLGYISSILHGVPIKTMLSGSFLVIKGFLLFISVKEVNFNEKDYIFFIRLLKGTTIFMIIFAVVDLLFYDSFRDILNTFNRLDIRSGIVSVQSLFMHPGTYGWFMILMAFYFLASYVVKKDKKSLVHSVILICFALLSLRFKVLLSFVVIAFFIAIRKGKYLISFLFLIVIAYFLVGDMVMELVNLTIDRYLQVDYTKSARKALYVVGAAIGINEFPLGVGFGRFGSWLARIDYSPVYYEYGLTKVYGLTPNNPVWATDTYWPSIIGEIGIIGAILLIYIIFYILYFLYKNYKLTKNKNKKVFILFALFVMIQSVIESSGEQIYNNSPQYILVFGIVGMAFALISKKDDLS